jgi:hypothetical protein
VPSSHRSRRGLGTARDGNNSRGCDDEDEALPAGLLGAGADARRVRWFFVVLGQFGRTLDTVAVNFAFEDLVCTNSLSWIEAIEPVIVKLPICTSTAPAT